MAVYLTKQSCVTWCLFQRTVNVFASLGLQYVPNNPTPGNMRHCSAQLLPARTAGTHSVLPLAGAANLVSQAEHTWTANMQ